MTIFDKFQQLAAARKELEQNCDNFFNIVMEEIVSGTEAIVNGRPMILAGSNNYLGLSFDAACIDAACDAADACNAPVEHEQAGRSDADEDAPDSGCDGCE